MANPETRGPQGQMGKTALNGLSWLGRFDLTIGWAPSEKTPTTCL